MFLSVRRTARRFGFKEVSDDEDWSLYWTDFSVALERVMDMKKYQVLVIEIMTLYLNVILMECMCVLCSDCLYSGIHFKDRKNSEKVGS